jgi:galactokinase/mevalonate kinase-like predicted kinase
VGHVNTATRKAKAKRLRTVKQELAKIAAKRSALWQLHEERSDATLALEISRLSEQIEALWEESRVLTAEIRNGARAEIIARARAAERIERDLGPRSRARTLARSAS